MQPSRRLVIAAITAMAGTVALYGTIAGLGNADATVKVADLSAFAKGQMATFVPAKEAGEPLNVTFVDKDGKPRPLSDWRGKVVVLNVWATWCAPCRKEMPSLDRLKAALGGDKFDVLAISTDRGGIEKSAGFLAEVGVTRLETLHEGETRLNGTLRIIGMPTTLLIDGEGREIGRLIGPAEWDGEDAKALVKAVMGG